MKAILSHTAGGPNTLEYTNISINEPKSDQIRICVKAAGVNFPDILMVEGKYQFKPNFPFAPGAEAAGEIISLGNNVTDFKIGQRVIAMTGHGSFADIAASQGFLTILLGGGNRQKWRQVAPFGGSKAILPTNPYCIGTVSYTHLTLPTKA